MPKFSADEYRAYYLAHHHQNKPGRKRVASREPEGITRAKVSRLNPLPDDRARANSNESGSRRTLVDDGQGDEAPGKLTDEEDHDGFDSLSISTGSSDDLELDYILNCRDYPQVARAMNISEELLHPLLKFQENLFQPWEFDRFEAEPKSRPATEESAQGSPLVDQQPHESRSVAQEEPRQESPRVQDPTARPAVKKQASRPAVQDEAARPAAQNETARPGVQKPKSRAVALERAPRPVSQESRPVVQETEEATILRRADSSASTESRSGTQEEPRQESPRVQDPTARPAVKEQASRPAVKEQASRPAVRDEAARPAAQDEPARPGVQERKSRAVVLERAPRPVLQESRPVAQETEEATILRRADSSVSTESRSGTQEEARQGSPRVHDPTARPAVKEQASRPAVQDEAARPAVQDEPARPGVQERKSRAVVLERAPRPVLQESRPVAQETEEATILRRADSSASTSDQTSRRSSFKPARAPASVQEAIELMCIFIEDFGDLYSHADAVRLLNQCGDWSMMFEVATLRRLEQELQHDPSGTNGHDEDALDPDYAHRVQNLVWTAEEDELISQDPPQTDADTQLRRKKLLEKRSAQAIKNRKEFLQLKKNSIQ
ncbi:hypothetical protein PtB15_9B239 [Puccinia triticina]|nr:hypothetical protein PtB15_9B239 [Puccinia triticina]